MPPSSAKVAQIALFPPTGRLFSYRIDAKTRPGMRVRAPFRESERVGLVVSLAAGPNDDAPPATLRDAGAPLDAEPVIDAALLRLILWCAEYYCYPPDRALRVALPEALRKGAAPESLQMWRATPDAPQTVPRAPRQTEALAFLRSRGAASGEELGTPQLRRALKALHARGWAEPGPPPPAKLAPPARDLNAEQERAFEAIAGAGGYACHLLDGVTGSGKTEVYLRAAADALAAGKQALILTPEIGLALTLAGRFRDRFGPAAVVAYHSAMGERERLRAWSAMRDGDACVAVGTRSAVFLPLARLGLIVVDEEHDSSFKQRDSLRYHARDLAILRARDAQAPIVLGSATPSLESLRNAQRGRFQRHLLTRRAGGDAPPRTGLIDLRGERLEDGLSPALIDEVRARLARGEQSLLFLNRRGYAPRVLCHGCGAVSECDGCGLPLIWHRADNSLRCHRCETRAPFPARCAVCERRDFLALGAGTERVEEALRRLFPSAPVMRVDTDAVRGRRALERCLKAAAEGEASILIGTQMLSKGHHFPGVTLVGVVNVDHLLFSADFRAAERLGQLVVQVAGRAGRAARPGRVLLQTHHPEHPLLGDLLRRGYPAFAAALLEERRRAGLPPFRSMALLGASAAEQPRAFDFLARARVPLARAARNAGATCFPPAPAMIERRGGRWRAQLILTAPRRNALRACLAAALPAVRALKRDADVRWHVDVDPVDLD